MMASLTEAEYLSDLARRRRRAWPADVPTEIVYPLGERPVSEYLAEWARSQPDRAAFVYYGASLTFSQLDEQSDRFAGFLIANGVQPGDRVAVMLPNCPQFAVSFYGILKAGAVHVPVSPLGRDEEVAHELIDTEAHILIAWDELLPMVDRVRDRTAVRQVVATSPGEYLPDEPDLPVPPALTGTRVVEGSAISWRSALMSDRPDAFPSQDLDVLAALNYTGGTTGSPKGCEHTQRHMLYTAACVATMWDLRSGRDAATSLVFLPMFWIAGEVLGALLPVFTGGTCVLLARWSPEAALAAVERYRVELLSGTVDNYVELMDHPSIAQRDLSSLRVPVAASFVKKLTTDLRRRWRQLAGDHSVLREAAFGMTETHTFDTFLTGFQEHDHDLTSRPVFCGPPMPGTEFKIVDFKTGGLAPLGEEGEICVRSPSVLTRYWRQPDRSATPLRDGWLHTGDIGLIDDDGCLHFLGRSKEMLKVNGMSVFPSELEVLLGKHPNIVASAVIGVPDTDRGEAPFAFVEVDPQADESVDEASLVEWCRQSMAIYKVPQIRIVESLPRTATGKIRKNLLSAETRA